METTFTQVQKLVAERIGVTLEAVHDGASFTDDLGADSLDMVEIIIEAEEVFNIEIPDEIAETLHTVSDLVQLVDSQKQ